jgi:hypothetical protein
MSYDENKNCNLKITFRSILYLHCSVKYSYAVVDPKQLVDTNSTIL